MQRSTHSYRLGPLPPFETGAVGGAGVSLVVELVGTDDSTGGLISIAIGVMSIEASMEVAFPLRSASSLGAMLGSTCCSAFKMRFRSWRRPIRSMIRPGDAATEMHALPPPAGTRHQH